MVNKNKGKVYENVKEFKETKVKERGDVLGGKV
jgi:hypothetical protein